MSDPLIEQLASAVRGDVITPAHADYDEARLTRNRMYDRRPAAIVRATDEADVMAAVSFGRERGINLAVRSGGHSVPAYGTLDDGIVLDMRIIRNVRVDPERRIARVGGGALLGEVDHATHAHGLATPAGFISTTGAAGLTLGGGVSAYLGRKHGLTCDNLVSADVVTAAGERVTASEDENADLFWALRGGGGNFGVVTSMEYALHPCSTVIGGPILFEKEAAADVMKFYREYIEDAPRELGGFLAWQIAPPLPFIPDDRVGDVTFAAVVCWSGDPDLAEEMFAPIRAAGPIVAEHVGPAPYPALQSAFDGLVPEDLQHYWKADFVRELTDEAIEAHVEYGPRAPFVSSTMHIYPMNGAVQDVGPEETAFAVRDAKFAVVIAGMWPDPAENEANTAWVRDYYAAIHPYSGYEGGYTNFMAADDQARVRENYGSAYDRLARIKAEWDPGNLFRLNQNIEPATA